MADLNGKNKILKEYTQREKFDQFENSDNLQKAKFKVTNIQADDKSSQSEDLLATQDDKKVKLESFQDSEYQTTADEAIIDSSNNEESQDQVSDDTIAINNKNFNSYLNQEAEQHNLINMEFGKEQSSEEVSNNKIETNLKQNLEGSDNQVEVKSQVIQEWANLINEGNAPSGDNFIGITINPKNLPDAPIPQRQTNGNYEIFPEYGTSVSLNSISAQSNSSNSSIGYYFADADGNPISGIIAVADVQQAAAGNIITNFYSTQIPTNATQIGLFIVPNGGALNSNLADNSQVIFKNVDGNWLAYSESGALMSSTSFILFSDPSLNMDGLNHVMFNDEGSIARWENDVSNNNQNFDDLIINFTVQSTIDITSIDDTLTGTSGNDTIYGGAGEDNIFGHGGDDTIYGGPNNDALYGGTGNDALYGGTGNDALYGGTGNDTLYGEEGDDKIHGGTGNDKIYGGSGNDTIYGNDGDDTIYGEEGDDNINAGDGNNNIFGGIGDDKITVGNGNNTIEGEEGNDDINAGDGNNIIFGGPGNNIITTGVGDNYIYGGEGDDTITTVGGNNIIYGGSGNNIISAGEGNDNITTEIGNDIIDGGEGNDQIDSGLGDDFVRGSGGDDIIYTKLGNDTVYGDDGNDIIYTGVGDDIIYGGEGDDIMDGGTGNDTIYTDGGNDTVFAGTGDDTIYIGSGNDNIDGGAGDDKAIFSGDSSEYTYVINSNNTVTITDTVPNRDGVNVLSNIELLQFNDNSFAFTTLVDTSNSSNDPMSFSGVPPEPADPQMQNLHLDNNDSNNQFS